jgi:hypothetical protein
MADRVGQASERVKKEARDAASDVATHARAVSDEIRDAATDVVDLSDPTGADDEQPRRSGIRACWLRPRSASLNTELRRR